MRDTKNPCICIAVTQDTVDSIFRLSREKGFSIKHFILTSLLEAGVDVSDLDLMNRRWSADTVTKEIDRRIREVIIRALSSSDTGMRAVEILDILIRFGFKMTRQSVYYHLGKYKRSGLIFKDEEFYKLKAGY